MRCFSSLTGTVSPTVPFETHGAVADQLASVGGMVSGRGCNLVLWEATQANKTAV